jgi:hypothetical protein
MFWLFEASSGNTFYSFLKLLNAMLILPYMFHYVSFLKHYETLIKIHSYVLDNNYKIMILKH